MRRPGRAPQARPLVRGIGALLLSRVGTVELADYGVARAPSAAEGR